MRLMELEREMKAHAARLTKAAAESGFAIEPADTRFARIATAIRIARPDSSGGTAFVDEGSKNSLLAIYFDRPCRLTGQLLLHSAQSETKEARVDVVVPRAGIRWVEYSSDSEGRVLISAREEKPHLLFVTGPDSIFRFGHITAAGVSSSSINAP